MKTDGLLTSLRQSSRRSCLSRLSRTGQTLLLWSLVVFVLPVVSSMVAPPGALVTAAEPVRKISFNDEIRPILSDKCFYCHGPDPDHREADLRLDQREAALEFLAIVPGKPEESELIRRLESTDTTEVMPPPHANRTVTPAEIALLRQWITEGADYDVHWAFKRLQAVPVPQILDSENKVSLNPVDAFVLHRLQQRGWQPNPPAPRETLLRRLCFDLTGLPPTTAQREQFLADDSPDAVEKLVDSLLASPQYGERMASEWLDVARYSDSYGFQVDRDRFVWPWRDWVVRAFNRNLSYDQFITEQIAGDLLPNATDEQILATTFNRLHPQESEGGSVPEEYRIKYIADRTQTFGTAFLGLTLECAHCHTHKYDPITQTEYYQLTAFFDNIEEAGLYSYFTDAIPTPTLLLADEQKKRQIAEKQAEIAAAEQALTENAQRQHPAFQNWLNSRKDFLLQRSALQDSPPNNTQDNTQDNTQSSIQDSPARQSPGKSTVVDPDYQAGLIPGCLTKLSFEEPTTGPNRQVAGVNGKALQLTGDDAVNLKVGNFPRHQPFSVTLWLNTPDVKERAVIFHRSRAWTDAGSRGYELLLEEGRLSAALIHFWPGNAIRVKTRQPLPTQTWQHVAITYDGSSQASGLKIYQNGKLTDTEIVQDKLTKNITGGGGDHLAIGERFRDNGFKAGLVDEFQVYGRQLTALEVAELFDGQSLRQALETPLPQLTESQRQQLQEYYLASDNPEHQKALARLQQLREQLGQLVDPLPEIMVMQETATPVPSHLLIRGEYDAKGEEVAAGVLSELHPFPAEAPQNRLGLAQWVISPQNPLTARVTVNRYWQMLFGEGLVRTPEDFGSQGQPPTHPELLDWLAWDFLQNGWNVQRLLKQIVLSRTYQQSSRLTPELLAADPENRWLTRFPSRRLPAEMVRDAVLSNSGLLVTKQGGPPVKPYEVEAAFKPEPRSQGAGLYRRSLYTYWKRNAPAPVMLALDASLRDVCRVKREKTMSPLQAFVLLNGPQFVEASRVLAEKLLKQNLADEHLLEDMFVLLTSRKPAAAEAEILQQLYQQQLDNFRKHPQEARELLSVGDHPADPELDPVRLAALAMVAGTLFNFDDVQRQR